MSLGPLTLTAPHQYIILVLSIFSFLLISLLLFTIQLHKARIPRNPIVTALLVTALPRILVLLMPFLVEDRLGSELPWEHQLRTDEQQGSALAKFCVFQGLACVYLFYYLLSVLKLNFL